MPRVLVLDPAQPDAAGIEEAALALREGKLVAFPTETVYGLGARAADESAIGRVYRAKGRPPNHPLIAHVSGEDEARALASSWPAAASLLAKAFWPGPLTVVVDRAPGAPACMASAGSSIAIRSPSHPIAAALLAAVREPVAAPSANRFQGLSPTTAAHVVKQLGEAVDLVIDGGRCHAGIESTVVDVRGEVPRVLRPGALGLAELRRVLPGLEVPSPLESAAPDAARPSPGMDRRHYAPRARLHVVEGRTAATELAERLASRVPPHHVGLVLTGVEPYKSRDVAATLLPDDPELYGRALYDTLHALDDAGVSAIVVQQVPAHEGWWAVADRLRRAATPGSRD
jgi:L-threonylcarbamoyladenylate synthase